MTRASSAKPSDSFPGLMNIVTGGTPKTHGAFYDLALICTLTGKRIDACCCQLKDGKLYCPLAKTYIDACCCKAAD
jgi:hypothetical protein